MKKIMALSLALGLFVLSACGAPLPMPEYPLDAAAIEEELKAWGLACMVQEDEWVRQTKPGQSSYNLYSTENGELIAAVSSAEKQGQRGLFISFTAWFAPNAVPAEECEDAMVFATRLFGGFRNDHRVYRSFSRKYGRKNTEKSQYKISGAALFRREGEASWKRSIDGVTCRVVLTQPRLDEPAEYILSIVLVSDWDTFYP